MLAHRGEMIGHGRRGEPQRARNLGVSRAHPSSIRSYRAKTRNITPRPDCSAARLRSATDRSSRAHPLR